MNWLSPSLPFCLAVGSAAAAVTLGAAGLAACELPTLQLAGLCMLYFAVIAAR